MKRWSVVFMTFGLASACVTFSAPSVSHQAEQKAPLLTPAQLTAMLRDKSAREVIDFLTQIENERMERWEYVLDQIETGNIEWLKIALLLSPATDADSAETLGDALAEATTRAPARVLLLFSNHCYIPDYKLPPTKERFLAEIQRRVRIVERVADPFLKQAKAECIREYQNAAHDANSHYTTR